MVLGSELIRQFVRDGKISVYPGFDERQLRPCGLRVHLANEVLVPQTGQCIDLCSDSHQEPGFTPVGIDLSGGLTIEPGCFILASTVERFRTHSTLVCRLEGRSTLARMGLQIHCSSSVADHMDREPRSIVLEIANIGPFSVKLPARYPIGMVLFERVQGGVGGEVERSQYHGQRGVLGPRVEFDKELPRYVLNQSDEGDE